MTMKQGAPNIDLLSYVFENKDGAQDKPVLIDASDPSRFVTVSSARKIVRQLIAGLKAEGFRSGDCVCVHSFNDVQTSDPARTPESARSRAKWSQIYYPLLYLAIIGAGGRFAGSNPAYTTYELNHHVHTAHVKYIISEPHLLSIVQATAKECQIPKERILVFDAFDKTVYEQYRSWTTLLQHGEEDWASFSNPRKENRTTIASLAFTSVTTGLPKAAMISHHFAVTQIHLLESHGKPYDVSRLICLPTFHALALPMITGCAIREQQAVYLMRRFDLGLYLKSIKQYHITEAPMVPAMISAILRSPLTSREYLQSLRFIWSGGSPLRRSTQADFQALLAPDAIVSQVWGMTETGWCITFFWPEKDDTGSAGRVLPGMSIKLKDLHGNTIDQDDVHGEMYFKATAMMSGYLDNPSATAATFDEEGCLKTGDIAYTREGKVYIIDRAKDLIKVRGWQVAPAEIEAILLTHSSVINAAVVGVPVPEGDGEVPRAFIELKPRLFPEHVATSYGAADEEEEVTEELVKGYVKERLARYKWLDGGVKFVESIPRNASGKVMKVKLRNMDKEVGKDVTVGEGENLKGVKAEDPTAEASINGHKTEGEEFNEKGTNGIQREGDKANVAHANGEHRKSVKRAANCEDTIPRKFAKVQR